MTGLTTDTDLRPQTHRRATAPLPQGWIVRARREEALTLPGGGPRRHRRRASVLLAVDLATLVGSFGMGIAAAIPFGAAGTQLPPAVLAVAFSVATLAARGLYSPYPIGPVLEVRTIGFSVALGAVGAGLVTPGGPWGLAVGVAAASLMVPVGRSLARAMFARRGWWGCRAVVVGAGATGRTVVQALTLQPELGLQPIAVLDDDSTRRGSIHGVPVVGPVSLARRFADAGGVEYAIIAIPGAPRERILEVVERYTMQFDRVLVIPDLFGLGSLWTSVRDLDGTIGLEIQHRLLTSWRQWAKRTIDVVSAGIGLAVLAAPLALIVAAIRLESPGPAVFRQLRLGRNGRCFECLKFRTMHIGADARLADHLNAHPEARAEWERFKKLTDDPRVTRVGRWLRRLSLDEVPQLWNVLRGEMSLVGPRAYLPRELDDMRGRSGAILRVRPGVTGLWQVSGRSTIPFEGRLDLDVHYVRNWSFSLDLYLLARTVPAVLSSRGAS